MTASISTNSTVNASSEVAAPFSQPPRPTGVHPAAELFPLMKDTDLSMLVEDIASHGLREPILVYQGLILDGRNRLRACEVAGVEPRFVEWDGVGSPLAVVLSRNLHRRHLNEGQRAIIAARAKVMFEEEAAERKRASQFGGQELGTDQPENGENTVGANLRQPGRSNDQAAELLNVSPRSVCTASRVLKSADEQVIAAVESGDVAVSDAGTVADRPKDQQRQALAAVRQGRARTLRHAAEQEFGAQSSPAQSDSSAAPSARELRREATRFVRQLDKLLLRLDALTAAFGANEHTDRMRQCLHHLVDLFRDFAQQCLPSK
ncbi:MAG TPA: ParB N-terminal domain-containing protein [Pirellulales bacterium]|nr:ParB N-terminal domain-containing protein [Pirellulales bacterium]